MLLIIFQILVGMYYGRHTGSKNKPKVSSSYDMPAELEVLEKKVKLIGYIDSIFMVSAISVHCSCLRFSVPFFIVFRFQVSIVFLLHIMLQSK